MTHIKDQLVNYVKPSSYV